MLRISVRWGYILEVKCLQVYCRKQIRNYLGEWKPAVIAFISYYSIQILPMKLHCITVCFFDSVCPSSDIRFTYLLYRETINSICQKRGYAYYLNRTLIDIVMVLLK